MHLLHSVIEFLDYSKDKFDNAKQFLTQYNIGVGDLIEKVTIEMKVFLCTSVIAGVNEVPTTEYCTNITTGSLV